MANGKKEKSRAKPKQAAEELKETLPSSLWEALNLPEPRRSDDRIAPKVDRSLLARLLHKELPNGTVHAVYRLIHAFDSWKQAYAEMVIEEFSQGRRPSAKRDKS